MSVALAFCLFPELFVGRLRLNRVCNRHSSAALAVSGKRNSAHLLVFCMGLVVGSAGNGYLRVGRPLDGNEARSQPAAKKSETGAGHHKQKCRHNSDAARDLMRSRHHQEISPNHTRGIEHPLHDVLHDDLVKLTTGKAVQLTPVGSLRCVIAPHASDSAFQRIRILALHSQNHKRVRSHRPDRNPGLAHSHS